MIDKKISELVDGGTPALGDKFLIARDGDNYTIDGGILATAEAVLNAQSAADFAIDFGSTTRSIASTASTTAGNAYRQANTATTAASSALTRANDAYTVGDNAQAAANQAKSRADSAYTLADSASQSATIAANLAADAKTLADAATSDIDSLSTAVTTAQNSANDAYAQANTAAGTANTALTRANNAFNQANVALSTASTIASTVAGYSEPNFYLFPESGRGGLLPLPNYIPQVSNQNITVAANATATVCSVFYTGQNVEITDFAISTALTSARTLTWHLYTFNPQTLSFNAPLYTGTDVANVNGIGRVADTSSTGIIGPGWYAVVLSVGTGTSAATFYGVPAITKYAYATVNPANGAATFATGYFTVSSSYFGAGTSIPTGFPLTKNNLPFQIPVSWRYTSSGVKAFQAAPGGSAG